jgi:regulator of protease activity HflC (stomatin/prohibitin superfamily)
MPGIAFVLIVVLLFFATAIKILREWERGVILRLGKFQAVRGPGLTLVIPLIERMYRINTRVVTVDVPPQDVISRTSSRRIT